jgi:methylated-DNA-[protein]-cysteine S-methyltransferase
MPTQPDTKHDHRWQGLSAQARIDTPWGPMLAVASPQGLAGLWFDGQAHHPGAFDLPVDDGQRWLAATREQLSLFARGERRRFELPLDLRGTDFQRRVWQALLAIPCGGLGSYGEIAAALGQAAAARAVGAAVGRNPVSIVVPCHRVLGRDGSLTGYAGGIDRKRALLALEAGMADSAPPDPAPTLASSAKALPAPRTRDAQRSLLTP